jgi:hypothetical protein
MYVMLTPFVVTTTLFQYVGGLAREQKQISYIKFEEANSLTTHAMNLQY